MADDVGQNGERVPQQVARKRNAKSHGQPEGRSPTHNLGEFLLVQLLAHAHDTHDTLRDCLATTAPLRSPIQMTLFLPFQNGEKIIFTAETITQRNGTVVAKQALTN